MDVLQVLNTIYTKLGDPGAIIRIDMDQEAHGEQCKVVVISHGVYTLYIVDATDWSTPSEMVDAIIQHQEEAIANKSSQSHYT